MVEGIKSKFCVQIKIAILNVSKCWKTPFSISITWQRPPYRKSTQAHRGIWQDSENIIVDDKMKLT